MRKWRMAHFRNDKSLFIAARTGAQPFMRFTCECELIVCTKGCEPGLAFKKRVKAIRECLLKRVCFWVPHFILPVLGESSGSKHSDLTDFKCFTFPFSLSFSVIFFYFAKDGKLYRNLSLYQCCLLDGIDHTLLGFRALYVQYNLYMKVIFKKLTQKRHKGVFEGV